MVIGSRKWFSHQLGLTILIFIFLKATAAPDPNYNPPVDSGRHVVEREQRRVPCRPPPPNANVNCIVCNGEVTVELFNCQCDVCHPGTYMVRPCRCTAEGEVIDSINCMPPELGKGFMPVSNWCDQPYPCTECEGDLVPKSECIGADDRTCDCPDDQYQTGPTTCQEIPCCPKDHQSQREPAPGSQYDRYFCEPCEEGYEQPVDGSLDKCRPITDHDVTDNPVSGSSKSDMDSTLVDPSHHTEKPALIPSNKTDNNRTCICSPDEQTEAPQDSKGPTTTPVKNISKSDVKHKDDESDCVTYKAIIAGLVVLVICVVPVSIGCGAYYHEQIYSLLPSSRSLSDDQSRPRQIQVSFDERNKETRVQLLHSNNTSTDTLDDVGQPDPFEDGNQGASEAALDSLTRRRATSTSSSSSGS